MKLLAVDLVIVNEKPHSYQQDLQGALEGLVRASQMRLFARNGRLARQHFSASRGRDLLAASRHPAKRGASRALRTPRNPRRTGAPLAARHTRCVSSLLPRPTLKHSAEAMAAPKNLAFANGVGGFDANGREYVVVLREGVRTPQPWINVIANPSFGFLVSESGSGYTWSLNSHENQLTPWSNDPVSDPPGEAFYIRDNTTGEIWSPTALPIRQEGSVYIARHGHGYYSLRARLARNRARTHPIRAADPIPSKFRGSPCATIPAARAAFPSPPMPNGCSAIRAARSSPYILTEMDSQTGAIFARNAWEGAFGGRIAFADLAGTPNLRHRRSQGIHRTQRHARTPRRTRRRRAPLRPPRRGT